MQFVESWKQSFKNWSQWVNALIAAVGTTYTMMPPETKADIPVPVVSVLAGLAVLNIFLRNMPQKNKSPEE